METLTIALATANRSVTAQPRAARERTFSIRRRLTALVRRQQATPEASAPSRRPVVIDPRNRDMMTMAGLEGL